MCVKPKAGEKVVPVRCQPKTYPCPTCGRRGHRKRRLDRFVRSLAYGHVLWLHVFYAEYTARCDCRKYFRSCPPSICPKAEYDNLVREAVLNRILDDGLNAERTRAAMKPNEVIRIGRSRNRDAAGNAMRQRADQQSWDVWPQLGLSVSQQNVLTLYLGIYPPGVALSVEEIAQRMGKPVQTIRNRLELALHRLTVPSPHGHRQG